MYAEYQLPSDDAPTTAAAASADTSTITPGGDDCVDRTDAALSAAGAAVDAATDDAVGPTASTKFRVQEVWRRGRGSRMMRRG